MFYSENTHNKLMLLKLYNQDLFRKKMVMVASTLYVLVFISFVLMQSGILGLSKKQLTIFSNFMDLLALFLCLTFLVTSLFNVFYLEKEKNKLSKRCYRIERIVNEEQLDCENGKSKKKLNKSLGIKLADFCDKHGNKFDLLGSILTTAMQLVAVFSLTLPSIFNVANIPSNTAFNLQGIVDTLGNILFVVAAGMFLLSYLIRYVKNENKDRIDKKRKFNSKAFILYSLFFGCLLVCIGKVFFSFECRSGAIYTGNLGPFSMDILPLGLIIRTVGMVIFCIGYIVLINNSSKEVKDLKEELSYELSSCSISSCKSLETLTSDEVSINGCQQLR